MKVKNVFTIKSWNSTLSCNSCYSRLEFNIEDIKYNKPHYDEDFSWIEINEVYYIECLVCNYKIELDIKKLPYPIQSSLEEKFIYKTF